MSWRWAWRRWRWWRKDWTVPWQPHAMLLAVYSVSFHSNGMSSMKAGSPNELSSIDARPALLLLSLKRFYLIFCYGYGLGVDFWRGPFNWCRLRCRRRPSIKFLIGPVQSLVNQLSLGQMCVRATQNADTGKENVGQSSGKLSLVTVSFFPSFFIGCDVNFICYERSKIIPFRRWICTVGRKKHKTIVVGEVERQ